MHNIQLAVLQLQGAKFVPIPLGQKGPATAGWQHNPKALDEIPENGNVGVLLGPKTGLCAIDFDGFWGWDFFAANIGPLADLPHTVTWSSGKPGRCQMLFRVPEAYWDQLRTRKEADKSGSKEGFELRWNNVQSVLPPSIHPDTKKPYQWEVSPCDVEVAALPDFVLTYWMQQCKQPEPVQQASYPVLTQGELETEVFELLEWIKRGNISPGYDVWARITWATIHALNDDRTTAFAFLKSFWPEQERNDYDKLVKSSFNGKRVTIGTLKKMARDAGMPSKKLTLEQRIDNLLAASKL